MKTIQEFQTPESLPEEVEELDLIWVKEREDLYTAPATKKWWELWSADKRYLKDSGVSCRKKAGAWFVHYWIFE